MAEPFTAAHLKKFLRKRWKETGCQLKRKQRLGVRIGDLVSHSAKRNRLIKDPHFDLWIEVYDEFVSWLVSLVTVAHWNSQREPYRPTDFEKAVVLLLMRIVADSLAIRHLMLLGFDAAARAQVRSTTEHMEVLAAVLDDPTMGSEFCRSDDPPSANKFWKAYLAKHKIRPRIKEIWLKFFGGEHDPARWFANWGSKSYPELSAIAHPSFMGCVHSVIPVKANITNETWLGMWGDKSLASIGTIQTYISFLFPLILAIDEFPFGERTKHFRRPRQYSATDELHNHVKHGRSILASLVLSLNKESNFPFIYPDLGHPNSSPGIAEGN